MPLKNAGSQITFTSIALNMYVAIIVGYVEAGLAEYTFCHKAHQWWHSHVHWNPRHWWCLENGSWRNGMRATSPALKRRWWTVEADRSKPVAVLQHRLNIVDEAVRSVTAMWTRWWSSHAVVTLCGSVPARLCVRPSSLHWFHIRITVIAACPVRAAMSWYDKPASRKPASRPTILPVWMHSLANIAPFCVDEAYLH